MVTSRAENFSQSALDAARCRVILLLEVESGGEHRLVDAYAEMRDQVAGVPGHISDQLCQSIDNPRQLVITSEWESARHYLAWVDSPAHLEMVKPLHGCVRGTSPLRFTVLHETVSPGAGPAKLQGAPRVSDGLVRHAITFTVRPGSEPEVAALLAGYASPQARVDDTTRLVRTSLFMRGNRVVRTVEVSGDLTAALRHVAAQPEVRAVEEAVNPYLEQPRDFTDPASVRDFFVRAAVPAVHHVAAPGADRETVRRHALYYPAKPGCGDAVARLLARQDEAAVAEPGGPVAAGTVFLRGDVVVRLVGLRVPLESAAPAAVGIRGRRMPAVLARLLSLGEDASLGDDDVLRRFVADNDMRLLTDRRAASA